MNKKLKNSFVGQSNKLQDAIFVHSLFRSGSTFFYNALKRTELFHVYHEPMHEVIATLPTAWNELAGQKAQLKSLLRHDFLQGGYFDEYAHLLPAIKKTFDSSLSFDLFFMNEQSQSPVLTTYIDTLIEGSQKSPILQCTRTVGRVRWLKANFASKHVFILRNPWDQWYSYKVDQYIAATPRLIYSQPNLPPELKEVMVTRDLQPLPGLDTLAQMIHSYANPICPEDDYFLFFGLWLYAFIVGHTECDVLVDMDDISSNKQAREETLTALTNIGLATIDLDDVSLHRSIFVEEEQFFYEIIEEQVLEIFRKHVDDAHVLKLAGDYLDKQRKLAFVSSQNAKIPFATTLEDATRLREILQVTGKCTSQMITSLNQAVTEREGQIVNITQVLTDRDSYISHLEKAVTEREGQIVNITQVLTDRDSYISHLEKAVTEREGQIVNITQVLTDRELIIQVMQYSHSWRVTRPLRSLTKFIKRING